MSRGPADIETSPASVELQTPPEQAASGGGRWAAARRSAPPWLGIALVLVIIVIVFSASQDLFWTSGNLETIFRGLVVSLLLGIGTTFLISTGMVDLSIGSLLSLSSVGLGWMIVNGVPVPLAVVLTIIGAGILSAGVNGLLIAKANLSFFIVTLGTLSLFAALSRIINGGLSISLYDASGIGMIKWMGDGDLGPFPAPVVIAIVLLVGGWFVLRSTTFGHAMSALGGNETAARLSGIRVARVKIIAFALNGLLIGLAAVIITGRLRTGAPDAGTGVELQVIAAVLLGGSSFFGGASSMVGTFIGVLFVAVLQNGMNLMGVQVFWQGLVTGVVLIAAVWLGQLRTRH